MFAARLFASATVESLGERFMREHVLVRCKSSPQREYRRALMLFINRKLGRRARDQGELAYATNLST
jgi:hypothetical protein